ncbi:MAG: hypothetical protein ACLFST_10500 [Spirochaetia bacterium]
MFRFFPLLTLIFVSSCVSEGISTEGVTAVVYRFGDSSVPPEYHRSYTITVTPASALAVVDSYGKELNREKVRIDESDFSRALKLISDENIGPAKKTRNGTEGCTGGTTEELILYKDDDVIFNGRLEHCGGEVSGTMTGSTEPLVSYLRKLFSDFNSLLD